MLFATLLRKKFKLSNNQVKYILCTMKLPQTTFPKKKILGPLTTWYFKQYLTVLSTNKHLHSNEQIQFFIRLRSLTGLRHLFHLPVNGQRSKTNANTQRSKGRIPGKPRVAIKKKKK